MKKAGLKPRFFVSAVARTTLGDSPMPTHSGRLGLLER
jgi:hypothetical protein